jgi:hypothetical protein
VDSEKIIQLLSGRRFGLRGQDPVARDFGRGQGRESLVRHYLRDRAGVVPGFDGNRLTLSKAPRSV